MRRTSYRTLGSVLVLGAALLSYQNCGSFTPSSSSSGAPGKQGSSSPTPLPSASPSTNMTPGPNPTSTPAPTPIVQTKWEKTPGQAKLQPITGFYDFAVAVGKRIVFYADQPNGLFQPKLISLNPETGDYEPFVDLSTAPAKFAGLLNPSRMNMRGVWTGDKLILWRGICEVWGANKTCPDEQHGVIYTPATQTWSEISKVNAPSGFEEVSVVWTGSRMIVWGGSSSFIPFEGYRYSQSGASYDPATNTWTKISEVGAPSKRASHSAVWTGTKMLVWGGHDDTGLGTNKNPLVSGGAYDPATDSWSAMPVTGAPSARTWTTAAWTGTEMAVWGGIDPATTSNDHQFADGALYNPATGAWRAITMVDGPPGIHHSQLVWLDALYLLQPPGHYRDLTVKSPYPALYKLR